MRYLKRLTFHFFRILDLGLNWRDRKISDTNFLIVLSVLIGIISSFLAIILKQSARFTETFLDENINRAQFHYVYLLFPLIGISLVTIYVKIFRKGHLEKGLGSIINDHSKNATKLAGHKNYTHVITGILTVGFGGSTGLEAPIVITGSAVGSNIASFFHLKNQDLVLLLACGAAAGIASIFNSPIAGVVFALEVLLPSVTIHHIIPLLISSATATVMSKIFHSGQLFYLATGDYSLGNIPFYILLSVFCSICSVYFIRMHYQINKTFEKINHVWLRVLVGGSIIGILVYLFPPLYGEGYSSIQNLMKGNGISIIQNSIYSNYLKPEWFLIMIVFILTFIKIIATSITLGAGGDGGTFAPSLFTGAMLGYGFSKSMNLLGVASLNEANFTAVAMAGILSGVMHAPLTGIFLIAEITGGYTLIVPLMIVSALTNILTRYFEPFSVYTKEAEGLKI